MGGVFSHHQVGARSQFGVRRDGEINPIRELPAAEIHFTRTLVIKLNVLIIAAFRDGMKHEFVDENVI